VRPVRLLSARRSAIAAIALLAGGAGAGHALAAGGGLSVSPGIFERTASPGSVGSLKISNTTGASMAVKVALRPWVQSPSGEVSPNRGKTLGEVRLSASSFTLGAGASQPVGVSLTRTPAGRSLYGAVEVTGTPSGGATNGVKIAYRLVCSLRLDAPGGAQSFRASAGSLIEQGSVKHGTLLLAVRNTGNTLAPIGGKVRISGSGHSLSANATAKAIVPGATVNVPLVQLLGSLPRGRYAVTVGLSQGGHGLGTVTRTIELR
jgi:hypothetical protein